MDTIMSWFAVQGFLPHGYCFQWSSSLLTLMVVSNIFVALAYYSIPLALLAFLDKRRDIKFNWIFILFSAFIFMCGTSHVMDIVTIWYPAYWVQGWVKGITALVSVITAALLWPVIRKVKPASEEAVSHEDLIARLKLAEDRIVELTAKPTKDV